MDCEMEEAAGIVVHALKKIAKALDNVAAAIREKNSIEACRVLKEKQWTASNESNKADELKKTGL